MLIPEESDGTGRASAHSLDHGPDPKQAAVAINAGAPPNLKTEWQTACSPSGSRDSQTWTPPNYTSRDKGKGIHFIHAYGEFIIYA